MTDERKQELTHLLEEALANLEIRPRSANIFSFPSMDVHTYKAYLREHWTSYSSASLSVMNYVPHTSKTIESKLLDFIRKEFASFIREDRILSASNYFLFFSSNDGYSLTKLLVQLLKIAIVRGIEEAVLAFDSGSKDTPGFAQSIVLLEGIKIKTETPIFEGIRLVCLPNSTSELPLYARNLYNDPSETSARSFLGKTLLIIDYSVFPIFHRPFDSTTIQEYRKLLNQTFSVEINGDKSTDSYVADFSEEYFYQALSLACNSAVQASLKWRFLADDEIYNLSPGTGGSIRFLGLFEKPIEVGQSEIDKAKHLYGCLTNLDMETLEKLKIPIGRWIKSHTSQMSEDKIIDLGIASESLYLSGIESKNEIRFRFSLHAAWHLGENKNQRTALMKEFKAIYDWRSTVVHTGKLPKKTKNTHFTEQEIKEFIEKAQDLCRDSIMKILEDGKFPDWDDLILG